ncbi:MAG: hypothetical protein QM723_13885 [Myxococcaceae bacterium]
MRRAVLTVCVWSLSACTGTIGTLSAANDSGSGDSGLDASVPADSGVMDAGHDAGVVDAGHDAGVADAGVDSGTPDAGPADSGFHCGTALLCETFDEYDAGALLDGVTFGPWRVNVQDSSASANIDTTRSTSGTNAFHVHIDQNASSGAQLKTRSNVPLFASTRTQLYGRFMMYLGPDGTSIHWTMWGASGTVPQGTTSAGAYATYLFSAFNLNNANEFGEVYGNDGTGQDCYHESHVPMPIDDWACISFSVDSAAIQYRMSVDGGVIPSMSLDTMGDGCVTPPNQTWWGPLFDQFYIGALSFHPMTGPLDLWIDDLIVDTQPVGCP